MQCNLMQYEMVQYNAAQYNTKLRPCKLLAVHSADIMELVGVFSVPSWAFLSIQITLWNA